MVIFSLVFLFKVISLSYRNRPIIFIIYKIFRSSNYSSVFPSFSLTGYTGYLVGLLIFCDNKFNYQTFILKPNIYSITINNILRLSTGLLVVCYVLYRRDLKLIRSQIKILLFFHIKAIGDYWR